MREVGGQIVGDAVGEKVLFLVAAQILEWQNDDGEARRVGEFVLGGRAQQTRCKARMPGVGPRREKHDHDRGGKRAHRR